MQLLDPAFNLADLAVEQAELFFLVFMRFSALVFLMPFFKNENLLSRFKIGLAFFLTLIIFPFLSGQDVPIPRGPLDFGVMVIQEVAVGLIMGISGQILIATLEFCGFLINREIGLSMMPILNPLSGENSNSLSQFLVFVFGVLFLASESHFYYVEAMTRSYDYIPLVGINWHAEKFTQIFTIMIAQSFVMGFQLAAPIITALFISLLGMAFMARVMPNMNIWLVSIPLKIGLGVFTLIYVMPFMYTIFQKIFEDYQWQMLSYLKLGGMSGS
jgi:flagellar biosynthetic protein FliR